jgi:formate hydrogenlyase subunit 4
MGLATHARRAVAQLPELVLAAAVPDVRGLLHLGAGRNQPAAVRSAEAESELVAGFMVEYGSTPYMLFMLGEYIAIMHLMCALTTILFLGGWLPPI